MKAWLFVPIHGSVVSFNLETVFFLIFNNLDMFEEYRPVPM